MVRHVTFFDKKMSDGAPRETCNSFKPKEVSWGPLDTLKGF